MIINLSVNDLSRSYSQTGTRFKNQVNIIYRNGIFPRKLKLSFYTNTVYIFLKNSLGILEKYTLQRPTSPQWFIFIQFFGPNLSLLQTTMSWITQKWLAVNSRDDAKQKCAKKIVRCFYLILSFRLTSSSSLYFLLDLIYFFLFLTLLPSSLLRR